MLIWWFVLFSVPWTKHQEECWASPLPAPPPSPRRKAHQWCLSFPRSETNYYEQMACLSSHFVIHCACGFLPFLLLRCLVWKKVWWQLLTLWNVYRITRRWVGKKLACCELNDNNIEWTAVTIQKYWWVLVITQTPNRAVGLISSPIPHPLLRIIRILSGSCLNLALSWFWLQHVATFCDAQDNTPFLVSGLKALISRLLPYSYSLDLEVHISASAT